MTGTESAPNNEWTPSRMEKFWQAMAQLYGRRWFQDHGEAILSNAEQNIPGNYAWFKALESMTPNEAAMGWRVCRDSGDEHPCTLPQFLERVKMALRDSEPVKVYRRMSEPKEARTERAEKASEVCERLRDKLK